MPANPIPGLPTVLLSSIGGIEIDVVMRELHRYENLVTRNPVESGAMVTDHIINQPVVLEIEGRIVDFPLSLEASLAAGAGGMAGSLANNAMVGAAGAVAGAMAISGQPSTTRAKEAAESLRTLWKTRALFEVVTGLRTYSNLTFEVLEFPRSAQSGRSTEFAATLREVLFARTGTEQAGADRVAGDVLHTAPQTSNLGFQPTQAVNLVL